MNSIRELLHQIPDPHLSTDERVRLRCQLAKQFERIGNHYAARGVMDDLWHGFGEPPNLSNLDERTSAEVLLRIGVLTGWIGSTKLIKGSQNVAKRLINESITIFESIADVKKIAEAQIEIGFCCMREGALEVARGWYAEALTRLDDQDGDLKALALLRSAILESSANRLNDALNILTTACPLFEASTNHVLKGCFHNQLARLLKSLETSENRPQQIDRVLKEYTAASFHFEQAGHTRYRAVVENNLAMLLMQVKNFGEAHEHLDCAQALYTQLNDSIHLAQLDDSRAQVLLAEGAIPKAAKVAHAAVRLLEKGDDQSSLAEALTTEGIALSHLHLNEQARAAFERAINVAEQAGHSERAGLASLTLIEQLAEHLSEDELCFILERARRFLADTQNAALLHRLSECACRVLSIIHTARPDWTTFSLTETLHRHEGRFIQMALEDAGGSVTKAASLLGLTGHQTLGFILNQRHQQLLTARTPIKRRRRRIFVSEAGCPPQHVRLNSA